MQDESLKGKVALITGAAHGLGQATAYELAAMGAQIGILDRHEKGARQMAESLAQQGAKVTWVAVDVGDGPAMAHAIEQVRKALGDPLVAIANAGIAGPRKPFQEYTHGEWANQFRIHMDGTYFTVKNTIDAMLAAGWGRIVCTASVAATWGIPHQTAYAAAKGAIVGFVRSLARETANTGVTVNAVAPGWIDTGLSRIMDAATMDEVLSHIPMERFGEPKDIAKAVAYFCSSGGDYVTGQVLSPNGGLI